MIQCTYENGDSKPLRHAVVDGVVIKDGKILLVKRTKKLLEGGKWALPGGFMDRDETSRQAVAREIMEETGWTVQGLQLFYVNDNPNRQNEDRQNVSFIYLCEAIEKTGQPDLESDEQQWFDLEELPGNEQIAFDHADTITLYKKYLHTPFALPVTA